MRVRSKVNLRVYDATNEQDVLFAPADAGADLIADNFAEVSSGRFNIAASGSFAVPLGTVNAARCLYIRAVGDVDVTLNGAAAPIQVRRFPGAAATAPARLYLEGIVTSVTIVNSSSTSAVEGWYCIVGDAT